MIISLIVSFHTSLFIFTYIQLFVYLYFFKNVTYYTPKVIIFMLDNKNELQIIISLSDSFI